MKKSFCSAVYLGLGMRGQRDPQWSARGDIQLSGKTVEARLEGVDPQEIAGVGCPVWKLCEGSAV